MIRVKKCAFCHGRVARTSVKNLTPHPLRPYNADSGSSHPRVR